MKIKFAIVNGSRAYVNLFSRIGEVVGDYTQADVIVFTGGEDVSPFLYEAQKHPATFSSRARDYDEIEIYEWAKSEGKPCVGICRGGQFLNVMSGGEMYQDVTNHCGDHCIVDALTGETILVSSTHHQMMKPGEGAIIVATSTGVRSEREWYEGNVFKRDVNNEGIEVVFYDGAKNLCFQPHPEFHSEGYVRYDNMFNYFKSLIERYIKDAVLQVA